MKGLANEGIRPVPTKSEDGTDVRLLSTQRRHSDFPPRLFSSQRSNNVAQGVLRGVPWSVGVLADLSHYHRRPALFPCHVGIKRNSTALGSEWTISRVAGNSRH